MLLLWPARRRRLVGKWRRSRCCPRSPSRPPSCSHFEAEGSTKAKPGIQFWIEYFSGDDSKPNYDRSDFSLNLFCWTISNHLQLKKILLKESRFYHHWRFTENYLLVYCNIYCLNWSQETLKLYLLVWSDCIEKWDTTEMILLALQVGMEGVAMEAMEAVIVLSLNKTTCWFWLQRLRQLSSSFLWSRWWEGENGEI